MAQRLEENEATDLIADSDNRISERYPWDEWLDGSYWLLKSGVDYTVTNKTFQNAVYRVQGVYGRIALRTVRDVGYIIHSLEYEENADAD